MDSVKLAVIGGGPAGLAAALSAWRSGIRDLVILERDHKLGGILNQCIHTGFGLHTFHEELTGPEYALRYVKQVEREGIPYLTDTMVMSLSTNKVIRILNRAGIQEIQAEAVILAMGCRERPRGALNIPGHRPAGIFSAGTAQHLINVEGYLPGREVVILGSGDIGLIMARRMTLEGAKVKAVAELMPYSSGLNRNIIQCLEDYGIPLNLSTTVVDIRGKDRVEGVVLAHVDEKGVPQKGQMMELSCDTLLLSCGLIPENELTRELGAMISPVTGGAVVNESLETSVPGVFSCGNVLHVHDLVDHVSEEADRAGRMAAVFLEGGRQEPGQEICLIPASGIRYTVPQKVNLSRMEESQTVRFRVDQVYQNARLRIQSGENQRFLSRRGKMTPGEMEQVVLKKRDLSAWGAASITIGIETAESD